MFWPRRPAGCRTAFPLLAAVCLGFAAGHIKAADPAAFEGLPLMRTFSPLDYHANTQCWSAAQDARGVMYIGNYSLVLEYDGSSWRKIATAKSGWINAMAYEAASDRVYVAGHDELGYLQSIPGGERVFVSLLDQLPADARDLGEIRAVYATPAGIFFVGEHRVARWREGNFRTWGLNTTKQLHSGWVTGGLYVHTREIGLLRLEGDAFSPATDDPIFRQVATRSMVAGPGGEVLVATYHDGVLAVRDGTVKPWDNALNGWLKEKGIYQMLPLRDGSTAIATDTAGLLILDPAGRFRSHVDNAGGLHGNNLLNLYEDVEGGLWIGLQSGVTRAEIRAPFSLLSAAPGDDLSNTVCEGQWFGTTVLGTLSHLYRVVPANPATATGAHLERLADFTDTFTSAVTVENGLLLAASGKVVLLDRDARLVPVLSTSPGGESHLRASRLHPGRVYVGESNGQVRALQLDAATQRWTDAGMVTETGQPGAIYGLAESARGDLWLGTNEHGLFRARPGPNGYTSPATSLFKEAGPLQEERSVWIPPETDSLLFQTPHRLYRLDKQGENIRLVTEYGPWFTDGSCRIETVLDCDGPTLWVTASPSDVSSEGYYGRAIAEGNGQPAVFQNLPRKVEDVLGHLQGFFFLEPPPEKLANLLIVGSAGNGIVRLDVPRWEAQLTPPPFATLIRRAVTTGEGLSAGQRPAILQDPLPFARNSVRFEYCANTFALGAAPAFQTRLADSGQSQWSDFGDRNVVDYFNLPAGSYTFEVRARKADGQVGGIASFSFRILPPWQRTWWAYALYALLAVTAVYALVRWRLWRLRAQNTRLEQIVETRTGELRHARDAADGANRAKSVFLANMTHELRTPLNAILGYSRILLKDPELSARNRERITTVDRSGNHLLSMINEVLDLSKIEAGKLTLLPTHFSPQAVLDDLCAAFRPRFSEKGVAFECVHAPGLPAVVHTDAGKLRQVLFNLLGNALKFTARGTVRLETATAEGGKVRFIVEDTGVGIAAEDLRHIFLAFHQAGDSDAATQGTGLGLSISQRLVELLGGRLEVASTPGQGSRFSFELELPPAAVSEDFITPGSAAFARREIIGFRGPPRRLLIVDDETVNRQVLIELLAPLGFETEEAADGAECLRRCAEHPPDAVLLDLRMRPMGGLEVASTLRSRGGAGSTIRIVAISASVFADDRQQAIDAGCDDFLPKPFEEEHLLAVLGRLLGLEWLRAEPPTDPVAPLPHSAADPARFAGEVRALLELARNGDILKLTARFATLRDTGGIPEKHLPLVHRLEPLLASYEVDRIHDVLQQFQQEAIS